MKASNILLYIDGQGVPSNPIYADNISIEKERESEEMYHRTKVGATLTFVGEDFRRIYGSSLDSEFEVEIYDEETDWLMARGTFERTDCKFNLDDEICEVKISSADDYDKIVNGKKNEYDIVSLAPERESVTLTKRAILQIYFGGDKKITNVIGNMSYEVDAQREVNDDTELGDMGFEPLYKYAYIDIQCDRDDFPELAKGAYRNVVGVDGRTFTNDNGYYFYYQDGSYYIPSDPDHSNHYQTIHKPDGSSVGYYWIYINDLSQYKDVTIKYLEALDIEHFPFDCGWGEFISAYAYGRVLVDRNDYHTPLSEYYELDSDDISANNLNYHYAMRATFVGLKDLVVRSFEVQDEPTKYGVNGDGKYFVQPAPLNEGDNVIPIGWNKWIPMSFWLNSTPTLAERVDLFNSEWTLRDAYPLWSVIDVLLKQIDPDITFRGTSQYSEFLYGNADLSRFVKQLWYITPITNVKKTYYDQAARKGKLTLENIFNMLRNTCQLYWFVDNGKLRIEHISWFKNGGAYTQSSPIIDLTSILSPKLGKNWCFGQNTISFDKSLIANRYEFSWAEEVSEVFDGYAIDIHNPYAKGGKTIKASADKFVSDIDLIVSAPDVLGDDNFALIGTGIDHKCPVASVGNFGMDFVVPEFIMQNPYFSFYFLAMAYWCNDLGGDDASFGDFKNSLGRQGKLDVFDIVRAKKQNIKFPISPSNADKMGLIKTEVGNGEWVKSKHTIEDGMVEMELLLETKEDISWGVFQRSDNNMTFEYFKRGDRIFLTINGNKRTSDHWGYLKITTKKAISAKISASSDSRNFGYLSNTIITDIGDWSEARCVVDNLEVDYDHFNAGDIFYYGYVKDVAWSTNEDKIVLELY